ncbi:MAG: cysteine desulfurase [Candidatus Margulisbacteria bacterium]|nr:cysteine desulfurase [Candidatus Margulisiibacteriota bacterium]MBU1022360.1 cysteine desulfurase [Candidatus Margulisiibacteriota bacterium]MBU1729088.1 cysteine desulfurase [Candidatus Margulisiibacteriota bacterium]MBU1954491.1 cysteine desulfurase [Candidatus Margulisiibacteriota bacterium]
MPTEAKRKVYFDNMANTPPDHRVIETMLLQTKEAFGNPLNIHDFGEKTAEVIESSRKNVAELIGATPAEIIFTSCGSESNNFAIRGIAKAYEKKGKHIISSAIEHFSVLQVLKALEKEGFKVTYLPVDKNGVINSQAVAKAITPETILVTLTHASNEIGTIEPIAEIGKIVKDKGIIFHVDAVQTAGTIPLNVAEFQVDALTLSANLFYGPTGIAALYLKKGTRIVPFLVGGTQEEGKRAGTQNIPGISGMGKAAELAKQEMNARSEKLIPLRDRLLKGLTEKIDDFFITGHPTNRLPGHASGVVKYIEGESMSMLLNMEGIAVSTGSACVSKALKASHVVLALGVSPEDAHGSLVFSMGKDASVEDVDYVLAKLPPIVKRLREMSPLYPKKKGAK